MARSIKKFKESMSTHETQRAVAVPLEQLRHIAVRVAEELRAGGESGAIPADVRARFITLRAALFQRGIYDPVLVRYDSATAPRASLTELADQLEKTAEALGS